MMLFKITNISLTFEKIFILYGLFISGLFVLLLMVLEGTHPGLSSPLRPICDLRVLDHFTKEAWDAEAAMVTHAHND